MSLSILRSQIDVLNRQLVALLGKRMRVARKIAKIKKEQCLPILDLEREGAIKEEMKSLARTYHLSASVVEEMFDLLLSYTRIEMELEVLK